MVQNRLPLKRLQIEVPKSAGKVEVMEVSQPSEETKVEPAAETLPETTVDTKVTELKWVEETRAEGPAAVGDTKTKESKSIQEVEEKPVEETMERPKPVEESRIGEPKSVEEIKLEGPKPVEDVQVARPVEEVKIEKEKSVEEARSRPETEPRLETVTVPEVVEKAKEPEALQQTATKHDVPFEESKITTVIQEPGKLDKKQFLPTDLLEEEIQIPKTKSPSPKPKHKHVSSVTIEEVESSGLPEDLPVSSTPKPTWQKRQQASALFIEGERQQSPVAAQDLDIRWAHTQALERVKNLQNARKTHSLERRLVFGDPARGHHRRICRTEKLQRSGELERPQRRRREARRCRHPADHNNDGRDDNHVVGNNRVSHLRQSATNG
jgi:hypothetical protein